MNRCGLHIQVKSLALSLIISYTLSSHNLFSYNRCSRFHIHIPPYWRLALSCHQVQSLSLSHLVTVNLFFPLIHPAGHGFMFNIQNWGPYITGTEPLKLSTTPLSNSSDNTNGQRVTGMTSTNTKTSTLSLQHSKFNTLTSNLSLQLSNFNSLTSTL